jgi:hypothetical protein
VYISWKYLIIQVNFCLLNVNFRVMFMITVNYHPLMGFDVNDRSYPGEKVQKVRNLHTCGLKHRVLETIHFLSTLP